MAESHLRISPSDFTVVRVPWAEKSPGHELTPGEWLRRSRWIDKHGRHQTVAARPDTAERLKRQAKLGPNLTYWRQVTSSGYGPGYGGAVTRYTNTYPYLRGWL